MNAAEIQNDERKNADITLVSVIGRGGFGIVYKGQINKRRLCCVGKGQKVKTVAVEVLPLDRITAETWVGYRERLATVQELKHDHLVRCHNFTVTATSTETKLNVIMNYCNGGDLAELLSNTRQDGRLPCPKTAVQYATHIAKGLEYLHDKHIIHGDIKPKNIFVQNLSKGKTKLLIGNADVSDRMELREPVTQMDDVTHILGTDRYMSPEMIIKFLDNRSAEYPGRSTDIWSLGCVILELADHVIDNDVQWLQKGNDIQDTTDFQDNEFLELIARGYVPVLTESIPSGLAECIRRCLQSDKNNRISAKKLAKKLRRLKNRMPREIVMLFHRRPGRELFAHASAEWLDPRSFKVHSVPLPIEVNELFSNAFTASGNELTCQTVSANEVQRESPTATVHCTWNLAGGIWSRIHLTGSESQIMYCPVRVGKKLYYFAPFNNCNGTIGSALVLKSTDPNTESTAYIYVLPASRNCCAKALRAVRNGSKIIYLGTDTHSTKLWMSSFDTSTHIWQDLTNFPDVRSGFAMVMLHGNLYVLGGATLSKTSLSLLNSCYRYSMITGTWTEVANLLLHRMDHSAFVLNKRIYVYGGTSATSETMSRKAVMRRMEMYDDEENKWSVVPLSLSKRANYSPEYCSTASIKLHLPVSEDFFLDSI